MSEVWKPSVTVAAIIERDGRFLMVEEHSAGGLRINQPAGHLEPGESLIDAAVREALEESAHVFTPTALVGTYLSRNVSSSRGGLSVTYLRFAFAGTVGEPLERALDEGILRAVWMIERGTGGLRPTASQPAGVALRGRLPGRPAGAAGTGAYGSQRHRTLGGSGSISSSGAAARIERKQHEQEKSSHRHVGRRGFVGFGMAAEGTRI